MGGGKGMYDLEVGLLGAGIHEFAQASGYHRLNIVRVQDIDQRVLILSSSRL